MPSPPLKVFISYAHRYQEWVRALHDNLELCLKAAGEGANVFLDDRDLESGRSWVGQLETELDRASHLILIATPEALASPRVTDEVRAFIAKERDWSRGHLHVAMLVETPLTTFLSGMQYADFCEHDEAKYFRALQKLAAGISVARAKTLPGGIEVPTPPAGVLAPALRAKLLAWLEPRVARRIYRAGLSTMLSLKEETLEGHSSPACCASALLVASTADDDPTLAALRVVRTLCEELGDDDPAEVAELGSLRRELEAQIAHGNEGGLLDTYLEKVDRDHSTLVPYFQAGAELELLDRVYVQQKLKLQVAKNSGIVADLTGITLRQALELDAPLFARHKNRWIVRGDQGSGKTTLLRHLAGSLAREGRQVKRVTIHGPEGEEEVELRATPGWTPVYESLPRLMREGDWLLERIARRLGRSGHRAKGLPAVLEREAKEGRLLLLLDGLDEVPKEDRDEAEELLRDLSAKWPAAALVVTSRSIGYRRPGREFLELDLLPFDHKERQSFLARWFGRRTGKRNVGRAKRELSALEEDPSLKTLARNPLYLTLIALLLDKGQAPQRNRTRLYDQVFELLLEGRYRPGGEPMEAKEATRAVLRYLAEAMTREDVDAESASQIEARLYQPEADSLREALERVPRWRRSVRPFLEELAEHTGILGEHDGPEADWRFWHRTFREALAAEQLETTYESGGSEAILEHARSIAGDESRWAEPYALLAGRIDQPDELIRSLVAENKSFGLRALATAQGLEPATLKQILKLSEKWQTRAEVYQRLPMLIGEPERALALIDRLRRRTRKGNDLYFLDLAAALVGNEWPEATSRVEEVRARLFDHIPPPPPELFLSVHTPNEGEVDLWRQIPEGAFEMGTPENEEKAGAWEWSQHRVRITSDFRLGAVPITNAQYAAFDPEHKWKAWALMSEFELAHHPVVEVTWYEAAAFCLWLGTRGEDTGNARLPTEEEWEYACRGGTKKRYWSGEEESDLARVGWYDSNSDERTHRVGEKPANPYGLYDVHGNVYEWTQSPWSTDFSKRESGVTVDPQTTDSTESSEAGAGRRVIRGGSFWNHARHVRTGYRNSDHPEIGQANVGFRVVLPASPTV